MLSFCKYTCFSRYFKIFIWIIFFGGLLGHILLLTSLSFGEGEMSGGGGLRLNNEPE